MKTPHYLAAFFGAAFVWAACGIPTTQADTAATADAKAPILTLEQPRADILRDGYIYLPFRVDGMTMLPLYTEVHGADTTKLRPVIGHLHVKVDGNAWSWIHASTDPIYFGPLAPGAHRVTVELADASHNILQTKAIEVTVR